MVHEKTPLEFACESVQIQWRCFLFEDKSSLPIRNKLERD